MRKNFPLDALLPKIRSQVLSALLLHPNKQWYVSELARHIGVTPSSLQRELKDLSSAGILLTETRGRMVYYQANSELSIYPELKGLLVKTTGLVEVLSEALETLEPSITAGFIYGSVARGDEQYDSDVDLLIVGQLTSMELTKALRDARATLNREVNTALYSPSEFAAKRKNNDHFLTRVLEGSKLFVKGGMDDLAAFGS